MKIIELIVVLFLLISVVPFLLWLIGGTVFILSTIIGTIIKMIIVMILVVILMIILYIIASLLYLLIEKIKNRK